MELDINDETRFTDPDAATIERELKGLTEEQFAVLKKDEMTYIQTFIDPDDGPILEYQIGSIEEHFATEETPTIEDVVAAFVSYNEGTDAWKSAHTWIRMDLT